MAKLYYTQIPSYEDLQQNTPSMHPSLDHVSMYSHVLLRKIATDLEVNLDAFFSQYNLSAGRFTFMALLIRHPAGLMPSELAQKVGVTQATISGLINSLEKADLVKRTTHEKDGRSFVILLTEVGAAKCQEIMPLYHERIGSVWADFNLADKHQLNSLLEKVLKDLHKLGDK